MKTSYKGRDLRSEGICPNCNYFGFCREKREGKMLCRHFEKVFFKTEK